MPPIVHDQAGALHKDAIATGVLAKEVSHVATKLRIDHFHFLVRARRHSFQACISLSSCYDVTLLFAGREEGRCLEWLLKLERVVRGGVHLRLKQAAVGHLEGVLVCFAKHGFFEGSCGQSHAVVLDKLLGHL